LKSFDLVLLERGRSHPVDWRTVNINECGSLFQSDLIRNAIEVCLFDKENKSVCRTGAIF